MPSEEGKQKKYIFHELWNMKFFIFRLPKTRINLIKACVIKINSTGHIIFISWWEIVGSKINWQIIRDTSKRKCCPLDFNKTLFLSLLQLSFIPNFNPKVCKLVSAQTLIPMYYKLHLNIQIRTIVKVVLVKFWIWEIDYFKERIPKRQIFPPVNILVWK